MIHMLLSSLIHTNSVTLRKLGIRHNTVTSLPNTNEATAQALGARGNLVSSLHNTNDEEASGELGQRYSSIDSSSSTQTNAATPRKLQTHLSGITSWPTQINAATPRKLQTRLSGVRTIYLLCNKLCDDGLADLFVIFISNEKKQKKRDEKSSSLVWDLDSSLPFPSPLGTYIAESIRPSIQIFSEFKRRHMKDSAGNWIVEPPSHEAIVAEDGAVNNLNEYITVSPDDVVIDVGADTVNVVFSDKLGVVVGENDLFGFFSLIS
ncbi:hypothetical protein BC332_12567 [Capsicum chinense]|nr:hypothetical protein BC332_12567 [Capsicum chinense]